MFYQIRLFFSRKRTTKSTNWYFWLYFAQMNRKYFLVRMRWLSVWSEDELSKHFIFQVNGAVLNKPELSSLKKVYDSLLTLAMQLYFLLSQNALKNLYLVFVLVRNNNTTTITYRHTVRIWKYEYPKLGNKHSIQSEYLNSAIISYYKLSCFVDC